MANQISFVIQLIDKFSGQSKKLAASADKIKAKFSGVQASASKLNAVFGKTAACISKAASSFRNTANPMATFRAGLRRVSDGVKRASQEFMAFTNRVDQVGQRMRRAGRSMFVATTLPIAGLAGAALKSAANLETLAIKFEVLTGSAAKGKELTEDLINFAAKTPFRLDGISNATTQLLSAGVATGDIVERLKTLGDISAITNVPLTDLSAIFSKIKNKNKAMTEEILQLSDRGIPIIDMLSKGFGVTKDKVFELAQEGKISFDIIKASLESMTQKGGAFSGGMERLSNTLGGVFSTLADNVSLALGKIGDDLVATTDLKENIKALTATIQKLADQFKQLSPETKKYIFLAVGLLGVLAPLLITLGLMASGIKVLATGFLLLTSPVGLAIGAFIIFASVSRRIGGFIGRHLGHTINTLKVGFKALYDSVKFVIDLFSGGLDTAITKIENKISKLSKSLQDAARYFGFGGDTLTVQGDVNAMVAKVKEMGRLAELQAKVDQGMTPRQAAAFVIENPQSSQRNQMMKSELDININTPNGTTATVQARTDSNQTIKTSNGLNMVRQ